MLVLASGPISYGQAIVLGLLQGVSELFPVSSLGHSVILPQLLGWNIHQNDPYFLTFLVATHLATAIVLLIFFWRDWVRILRGLGRSLRDREITPDDVDAKLGWLLVVGTIPAGILGLLLEHKLRHIFASPRSASVFLVLNGFVLYGAELLRRRAPQTERDDDARIARQVGWRGAFLVGAAQAIALIPGFSRSRRLRPRPRTIRTQSRQKNPSRTIAVARCVATRKVRKYGSFWWMSQPRSRGRMTLWPRLEIGNSSEKPWSRPSTIACP